MAEYRNLDVREAIRQAKELPQPTDTTATTIVPLAEAMLPFDDVIDSLCKWRSENQFAFLKLSNISIESTNNWATQIIYSKDRILWMIRHQGKFVGHIGFANFGRGYEICDVIRGEPSHFSVMQDALKQVINWATRSNINRIILHVASDVIPALGLYQRLGFVPTQMIPLTKISNGAEISWVETENSTGPWDRFMLRLEYIPGRK